MRFQKNTSGPRAQRPTGRHDERHRPQQRAVELVVDPRHGGRAALGLAEVAIEPDDAGDDDDRRAEREGALLGVVQDAVEALPEDVAEDQQHRRPAAGAEDVVGQEAPDRHSRGAGQERVDRADQADEAPEEDRLAAVAVEERLDGVDALLGQLELRPVREQELAPEPPAGEEADEVAQDRARPRDPDHDDERDRPLAGDDAAEDEEGLAGRDEPDERAGLEEGGNADHEVGPVAQLVAGVLDDLLEVRQLHEAAAVDQQTEDDDPAADQQRGLELAAANDQ
jgi:hypothetical protein